MKRMTRIWAGTAIGLLTASAPLAAAPLSNPLRAPASSGANPLIIFVAGQNCAEGESPDACAKGGAKSENSGRRQEQREQKPEAEPQAEKPQPKAEKAQSQEQMAPAESEQKPRKHRDNSGEQQQPAGEQAPAPQPAQDQEKPRSRQKEGGTFFKKKQQNGASETAPAATEQPAQPEPKARKTDKGTKTEQPAQNDNGSQPLEPSGQKAGTNDNTQPSDQTDRRKKHQRNKTSTGQSGDQTAPAANDQTAPAANGENPQVQPSDNGETFFPNGKKNDRKHRNGNKDIGQQPGGEPAQDQGGQAVQGGDNQPAPGDQQKRDRKHRNGDKNDNKDVIEQGGETGQPAQDQNRDIIQGGDNGQAPIFDSQKQGRKHRKNGQEDQRTGDQQDQQQGADQGPPPKSDEAAQQDVQPGKIESATREKGERIKENPYGDLRERHRPKGADVLKQIGDRLIIQFNNQTIVQSDEGERLRRGAQDVYYDDLRGNRTRETIVRRDGSRIVTIRDQDGNIIQRSRVAPDGHEYVLNYVDDDRYQQDVDDWRDPGDDLPPIRSVPRDQYILDSESVESPDDYYEFLEKPPVEQVRRLYSIGEVRRSARIRDIAPRIDLDTLNFDFGSAAISDNEGNKLQGVAEAMQKLLDKNPAETFLIEGHTDAVGSPNANLALSDQRAEAVADVLTRMFDIPPENLVTQGYGEQFLKLDTQGPERANRRVAIRRITPLVAPVASDQ